MSLLMLQPPVLVANGKDEVGVINLDHKAIKKKLTEMIVSGQLVW